MAKLKGKDVTPVYEAAAVFVDRVLRSRDSLFTPGRAVWSAPSLQDVYDRFIGGWDGSSDSFDVKLERQLAGAQPDTFQLFGELLYIHLLAGNSTGARHKRDLINGVLGRSRSPVSIPADLDRALERGLAAEGMAFKISRPNLLRYLVELVRKWWSLGDEERSRALTDPWAFKGIATSIRVPKSQSQVEILLHLVHPETFEPMMSRQHKQKIVEAFGSLVDQATDDVDRRLLQIRQKLRQREGREIGFYEPRLLATWQPGADPWSQFVRFAGLFYRLPRFDEWERDYKLRLAETLKPAVTGLSGEADETIEAFRKALRSKDQNIVRWQDFEPFVKWYRETLPTSHAAVTAVIEPGKLPAERIRSFLQQVPAQVIKSPASRTTLASAFLFAFDARNLILFRASPFSWAYKQVGYPEPPGGADEAARYEHALGFCDRFMNEADQRGLKLRDRLDAQGLIWTMARWDDGAPEGMKEDDWNEFVQYRGGRPVTPTDEGEPEPSPVPPSSPEQVESDPIGRLVLRRKNVVLYGPPGTGKTHASLAVAAKWRGAFGPESVLQVTFHPTFAYEDFIEGFRPDASGRFELRQGIFLQACERARKQADGQFLLVIDELNRGDVARVFGELITLIEADKRHSGVSRRLPYSQRELWVPPNLHLLGTMNTADRSISLLDVAIRRRFCFQEYRPDSMAIKNSTAHHREVNGVDLGDLMDSLNRRLAMAGVPRDRAIGHSHFLIAATEANPLEVLRDRFRFDVIPLVEEYCYADRKQIRAVFGDLVDEEGSVDEEALSDDAEFVTALRSIANADDGVVRPSGS